MSESIPNQGMDGNRVLVLGGGISGQRAALDLARSGLQVVLVESSDTLGGTVAQLGSMFPLHNCLLCRGDAVHGPGCVRPTISADLLDRRGPDRIRVLTRSRLEKLEGEPSEFRATVVREPRYVTPALCINCDRCASVCPSTAPDQFQAGLAIRKAAYRPAYRALPDAYAIDKGPWCEGCGACVAACPTSAIDLTESATREVLDIGAVVVATGMKLSDPSMSREYGYGRYADVFTGLEIERMCSPAGPGEGQILRRSNGERPERIAWIQCVGSRDDDHDYCSSFCCGYASRQAILARGILPDTEMTIFMMDDRVFAHGFSRVYDPLRRQYGIQMERCRISVITEDPVTRQLILQTTAPDGTVGEERYDMAVLSIGAEAAEQTAELAKTLGIETNGSGFVSTDQFRASETSHPGIFAAGAAAGPADVADSVTEAGAAAAAVCSFLGVAANGDTAHPDTMAAPGATDMAEARTPAVGVFLCNCAGDVAGTIDLALVRETTVRSDGVAIAEEIPFACLAEGLAAVKASVVNHHLSAVVVGGCSARTFTSLFAGELGVPVHVISLKEECARVHREDPAGATRKAAELVRIGAEHVRTLQRTPARSLGRPPGSALVVGAGVAGLTAGLHLADSGIAVHLVERADALGGHAATFASPQKAEIASLVSELVARAASHPRIEVHLRSEVVRRTSSDGIQLAVIRELHGEHREKGVDIGATVVAVGGAEYRGPAYGLGSSDTISTLLDLETGNAVASGSEPVVFIGCVGPWDEPEGDAEWRCSRSCCESFLMRAKEMKESAPSRQVVVLMREVNTYGLREETYTAARRAGVLLVRFNPDTPPIVTPGNDGANVRVRDLLLGEELEFRAARVVLAAATQPRPDCERTARGLDVILEADGFVREWEPKTRSVGTLETGVFVCGLAAGPGSTREVVTRARAAAQAAFVHLLADRVVHGGEAATIDSKKCASCLTCIRICPYGVPRLGNGGGDQPFTSKPTIDAYRCQGCGVCTGECPAAAITIPRMEQQRSAGIAGRWLVVAEGGVA